MTNACTMCGFDGAAPTVRSWRFFIARDQGSLNARVFNAGATRWRYAKERDAWILEVRAQRLSLGISPARGKRRLIVTRHHSGRQKERDYGNLVGGVKAVVDAFVHERLLVDDSPTWLEDHYLQVRSKISGFTFDLAELCEGQTLVDNVNH